MRRVFLPLARVVLGGVGLVLSSAAGCSSFSEADVAAEGGVDATSSDAANPGPAQARFADDFERNELLGEWTRVSSEDDANDNAITIDPSQHTHGMKSLHATVSGAKGVAFLESTNKLPALTRIEVFVRVAKISNPGAILVQIEYGNDTAVNLALTGTGLKLSEQKVHDGSFFSASDQTKLPLNEWVALTWSIDYAAKTMHLTSSDHSMVQIDYPLAKTDLGDTVSAVRAGVVYAADQESGEGAEAWVDDIAFY